MKKTLTLLLTLALPIFVSAQIQNFDTNGGVDYDNTRKDVRIGPYTSIGSTRMNNFGYIGFNAYLNSSSVSGLYNRFKPDWPGNGSTSGKGIVFHMTAGGNADLNIVGIDWGSSSNEQDLSSFSNIMTLKHNQLVGIGTTSPTSSLHILSSDSRGMKFSRSGAHDFGYEIGGTTFGLYDYTDGEYRWRTGNGHVILNESGGNVGIGTTSPNAKLDLRNGHLYVGDDTFNNPGSWGATINLDDNVHSRVLIEERGTGVQTALMSHTGGTSKVGTISNHDFQIVANHDEKVRIATNGNIGIGTSTPNAKLDLRNGHLYVGDDTFNNPGNWGATINLDDNVHSRILIEERSTGVQTSLWAHTGGNAKVGTISNHNFSIISNGSEKMTVTTSGKIGIGTLSPTEKLSVDGTVLAKKVRVSTTGADWPDYVFSPNYKLKNLSELEAYIQANQHLPEVPSTKEIEEKGQDLGDIQTTLLKKVEELTLYLIEQDKRNKDQEARLKALEEENKSLRKLLESKN
ncbi:hypothetical protein BFP97_18155 [Roseivirga sp. 4D4]|uniref:hypothetical protein n=1 Tax=Roseivirga sp. 4D4 TaxID=1889784 RepID=UPI000852BF70|nr:hypothetical protein [Roseivirga sp. 4D4]OEK03329.1 hypothetical protein BFP97_18155 [Roseivirga sp. 4D4]